jgi:hypothetical protein
MIQRAFAWLLSFLTVGAVAMEGKEMAKEPLEEPSAKETGLAALLKPVRVVDRNLPHGPENAPESVRAAVQLEVLVSGEALDMPPIEQFFKRWPLIGLYSIKRKPPTQS